MGSKIALKNAQDQEFAINHLDNAGAISINSSDISLKSQTESDIAPYNKGFKNYIINGGFDIWQRGTSFNILAGQFAYVADRFFVVNSTNQTVTIEYGTVNNGGIDGKTLNRLRLFFSVAPTSGVVQIAQKIEMVSRLVGKFTSSVYTATNESMYVSQDITQNFGIGGSASVITTGTGFTTTTSITRNKCTYNLPPTDSKTIGTNNYTQLTYSFPVRTTNEMTFTLCQLEEGSIATPFESRPQGLELSLCQRYYQIIRQRIVQSQAAGGYTSISTTLPVPMRTAPIATGQVINSINVAANAIAVADSYNFSRQVVAAGNTVTDSDIIYSLSAEL